MRLSPRISLFFRWYDAWIGAFYSRHDRTLYICPVPMLGVKVILSPRRYDPAPPRRS